MTALIVAYTKNRVIGRKGIIPWNLKNEKKRFKALTTNNVVVMGRKTFEEIGSPLPNRITVVVSSKKIFRYENCYTVKTLNEAMELAHRKFPEMDIYISGGERLYRESLRAVDKMFITEIDAVMEGDTFFPVFDENDFYRETEGEFKEEFTYRYLTYTRKTTPI